MNNNVNISYEQIVKDNTPATAGKWHYVRVFCAFFCSIATFASLAMLIDTRTHFGWLLGIMWFFGVIAGLLVSPGKFFAFGWGVVWRCAVFAWFILPFPFDLIPLVIIIPCSVIVAILALTVVPVIFTIYTYISDISYDSTDSKKERTAIIAGVGAALICAAVFLGVNTIGRAVDAPEMENSFDACEIYQKYAKENENAKEYPYEVLSDPVSSEKYDKGYVRENYYEFEQQDGLLQVKYNVTIVFEYIDNEWYVSDVQEICEPVGFSSVSGIWTGTGTYLGNLSSKNLYTLNFTFSKEEGGSGTLDISHSDVLIQHMEFTVEIGELTGTTDAIVNLKLILSEPITFETFGVKNTVTEIECVYGFSNNSVTLKTLNHGLILSPNE
ncbi:MAG: MFS transporter [Ruminococcaceae bacterium]|nr:MFS transporter [Oscillospiraceae bacterium]